MEELRLPNFDYHLDESDPDVVIPRRQDGAFVAAYSLQPSARDVHSKMVEPTPCDSEHLLPKMELGE
jgi:hypothetical protein